MTKKILFLLMILFSVVFAQENKELNLTGNLSVDNQLAFESTYIPVDPGSKESIPGEKSPLLAGVMSFVIPGSGEFYAESYWKAALFIAIEASAFTVNAIYNKHGDDQTDRFETFAKEHWSPAQYAKWTYNYVQENNPDLDMGQFNDLFYDAGRTEVNWTVLHELEDEVNWYSHNLDTYGAQQYFEMIGKYRQFNAGWDDFGDENTDYEYGDPVTPRFTYYSGERKKANDFYAVAKTALIVVVTNHIVSAIDAALTASAYNKNIEAKMGLETRNIGFVREYVPRVDLKFNF